jgi:hypothetical protein
LCDWLIKLVFSRILCLNSKESKFIPIWDTFEFPARIPRNERGLRDPSASSSLRCGVYLLGLLRPYSPLSFPFSARIPGNERGLRDPSASSSLRCGVYLLGLLRPYSPLSFPGQLVHRPHRQVGPTSYH